MLLELKNLLQQVVGALEDVFHGLAPVTVLEPLAAATGADVVAADPGEIERLGAPKRRPERRAGAGLRRLGRFGRLGDVLGRDRVRGRRRLGSSLFGWGRFLLRHRGNPTRS